MMVQKGRRKGKGKKKKGFKSKGKPKPKHVALKPKGGVAKECKCFHYGETKHQKRNCKVYLDNLEKRKGSEISTTLVIFVIKVNLSTSTS